MNCSGTFSYLSLIIRRIHGSFPRNVNAKLLIRLDSILFYLMQNEPNEYYYGNGYECQILFPGVGVKKSVSFLLYATHRSSYCVDATLHCQSQTL